MQRTPHSGPAPLLKVVIAGGSGSLGRALAADLVVRGHHVVILTRTPRPGPGPAREVGWDARTVGPWTRELQDTDRPVAVINLAGKLVDCRPIPRNVAALRDSRVHATQALVSASAAVRPPIAHWVQASTAAIYGDAGEQLITESSPIPDPGLPQMTGVARPWERAAEAARTDHLVVLRTSIVLDTDTPALDRLAGLARLGFGGPVGTGRQWFSWIHIVDWLRIVRAALGLEPVPGLEIPVTIPSGPLIAASDRPVRNAELMAALRTAVGRRIGLPAPAPLVTLGTVFLRTDPALALTGRHCTSEVLRDLGWRYDVPTIHEAVSDLIS